MKLTWSTIHFLTTSSRSRYEEYVKVLQEKEKQQMKNQRLEYKIPQVEKADMVKFVKKAMNSCSEFNSMFLKERKEERIAYFDMQTMNLHYPRSKFKVLPPEMTKPGTARLMFFFFGRPFGLRTFCVDVDFLILQACTPSLLSPVNIRIITKSLALKNSSTYHYRQ